MKRIKMGVKRNRKNFRRGIGVKRLNFADAPMRGGIRL